MDRAHIFFAVLLNLFSVQWTFCETGEPAMFLTPSHFEMRSMGAQPFIQAQFHPASGTIQQGIMLPQEHLMPQERIPEEYYYQERMVPQGSMVHQKRIMPPGRMIPQERLMPQQHFVPQESMMGKEHIVALENMTPQQRITPNEGMSQDRMIPQESLAFLGNADSQQRMVPQENVQKILHTNPTHSHPPTKQNEQIPNELTDSHNELSRSEELLRAVKGGYEYPHPQSYPQAPSYGYSSPPPNYHQNPASSVPSYSPPNPSYTQPAVHSDPATKFLLKPDLTELIKPVTGKMAGKLSGLLSLLSLFGSGKNLELGGIKDLLIDGILKPLLEAKGGLKALISKLAIPVVALILINVEVLITVWWLWEDCPVVKHEVEYTKPSYPATPGYNYR